MIRKNIEPGKDRCNNGDRFSSFTFYAMEDSQASGAFEFGSWNAECGKYENQTLNQAKGEITVSLNRGYPPFAMEKDGKIFGLDVDLAVTCIVAKTEDEMDSSYWKKEDKQSGQLIEAVAD